MLLVLFVSFSSHRNYQMPTDEVVAVAEIRGNNIYITISKGQSFSVFSFPIPDHIQRALQSFAEAFVSLAPVSGNSGDATESSSDEEEEEVPEVLPLRRSGVLCYSVPIYVVK